MIFFDNMVVTYCLGHSV